MRTNGYIWTSDQKSDPASRSGDLDFLWNRCISTTEWRLLDILFLCYYIAGHCDLDLL